MAQLITHKLSITYFSEMGMLHGFVGAKNSVA